MVHCHASQGAEHTRFLPGFALTAKHSRQPKALSMLFAVAGPTKGIQRE